MKQKRINNADVLNVLTESFLYKRFKMLALNMFKWEGLDDLGFQERHIEKSLFDEGKCFVFEDKQLGILCLPCEGTGKMNVYNDPLEYRVTGFGYTKVLKATDGVLIENNKLRLPTRDIIMFFTNQLYELVRTRDVNIKTLKLPVLLACNDKNVFSVKKALDEIDNNNWALVTDKNVIDLEEIIKVLPTGVKPFLAELTDQYHDILNEALTYLGINNANTDKKERLITDEANANNQFIDSCANMFLEARQRACDEINEKFGLNLSVELRNAGGEENALEYGSEHITGKQQQDNP